MPYEKGTAKSVQIPVEKLEAWETFLRANHLQLPRDPKPSEIIDGLWQLLNLWNHQPRTPVTVPSQDLPEERPATNSQQVSASDPMVSHAKDRLQYSPQEWIGLGRSQSSKHRRGWVLETVERANHAKIDDIALGLLNGQLDPYRVANETGQMLTREKKARNSVWSVLQALPQFYEFLGVPFKKEHFKVRVMIPENIAESQKKSFTYEETGRIIRSAKPELQTILSFHVSVGDRELEMFEVRVRDVDFATTPASVTFHGGKTKTGKTRISFLSSETVGLLKKWLGDNPDPDKFLFPGWNADTYYYRLMKHLKQLGITKRVTVGEHDQLHKFSHTPHSMRGTNLGITKRTGFPSDWAEILAGHATKVQKAYGDVLTDLGPEWQKLVEPRMRFLTGPVAETVSQPGKVETGKDIGAIVPPAVASLKPQDPSIGAPEKAVGPEKIVSQHEHKLKEPEYKLKPAPDPEGSPLVRKAKEPEPEPSQYPEPDQDPTILEKPQDPNQPVRINEKEWGCPRCDTTNTFTKESMIVHIRFRHPPPPKDRLEAYT